MKIGDLVRWKDDIVVKYKTDVGIILRFDYEDDPVVLWSVAGFSSGSNLGEYRDHVEVIQ